MLSLSTPEYAVRRMVRAISSAIDRSVLLNSSKPIGSRTAAASPGDPEPFRHPRPVGQALRADACAHDLDRLAGPGPVPVRPLVLLPERLRQSGNGAPLDGAPGHRHSQLDRLPLVAALGR